MKNIFKIFMIQLVLLGCSKYQSGSNSTSQNSLQISGCTLASKELRNPDTYDGLVQLINALPKPLSVECLLNNYDAPLKINATNSTFSAQPSEGPGNPRIFIIRNNFILSVVPTNKTQTVIEFAYVNGSNSSIKGELSFPINSNISNEEPFLEILSTFNGTTGTDCRFCHGGEFSTGGSSFSSSIIAPDPFKNVTATSMKQQLAACNFLLEPQRCRVIQSIYGRAFQEINWPF